MIGPRVITKSSRTVLRTLIALGALGALASPLSAQDDPTISSCSTITSTGEATRCIGSVPSTALVAAIDPRHTYTLPELIDLAETANPEGRIAWAIAKRSLERSSARSIFPS
jgi:outer membrane protein